MSKTTEPYDRDGSVRSFTPMVMCASPGKTFRAGYVITPHGVVGIYDQPDQERHQPYTRLAVAFDGRSYERSWRRTFSDRHLKTLAKAFAAEIAGRLA